MGNGTWIPLRPNRASQPFAGQEATAGQVGQDEQDFKLNNASFGRLVRLCRNWN